MKLFFKKNKLFILSFIILILLGVYAVSKRNPVYENDPILMYYNVFGDQLFSLALIAPLFVIIPGIYSFHKELHSGYIKNCLTRMSYKKYMFKSYAKAFTSTLILPLFIIIVMLMCCYKTGGFAFGAGMTEYGYWLSPDPALVDGTHGTLVSFMIIYVINMFLNSIFYLNIGIILSKKFSNYLVTVILSFLSFLAMDIMGEIILSFILANAFNIRSVQTVLNLFNIWGYHDIISMNYCLLYYIFLVLISWTLIIKIYKNKEEVLDECEK